MLLVDHQLKQFAPNIISPYKEELVEPNSVDILLGNKFNRLKVKDQFLNVAVNKIIDPNFGMNKLEWTPIKADEYVIEPNEFILAHSYEKFTIPDNMYGVVTGKSTIAREGLMIECAGLLDSGFSGTITLEIKNLLPYKYKLYFGQMIAQIMLFSCGEAANPYNSIKNSYQEQSTPTSSRNIEKIYKYCPQVRETERKNRGN